MTPEPTVTLPDLFGFKRHYIITTALEPLYVGPWSGACTFLDNIDAWELYDVQFYRNSPHVYKHHADWFVKSVRDHKVYKQDEDASFGPYERLIVECRYVALTPTELLLLEGQ